MSNPLKLIQYTKNRKVLYNGKNFDSGYHSINIDGVYHRGQRDCIKRLEIVRKEIDLKDKKVLDIGCSIGGMLFPLNEIKHGVGIELDYNAVNAANYLKKYKNLDNIDFYSFDLDKDDLNLIDIFIQDIDVVFLYAVCVWIKKWKELIDFISKRADVLFFESNGTEQQQKEQIDYCKERYKYMKHFYDRSIDDNGNRKLYMFSNTQNVEFKHIKIEYPILNKGCSNKIYLIDNDTCMKKADSNEIKFYQLLEGCDIIPKVKQIKNNEIYMEKGNSTLFELKGDQYVEPLKEFLLKSLDILREKKIQHNDIHEKNIVWFEKEKKFKLIDPVMSQLEKPSYDNFSAIKCYLFLKYNDIWQTLKCKSAISNEEYKVNDLKEKIKDLNDNFIEMLL